MSKYDPAGSRWRKWDLHIHTPASFHWKGERFFQMDAAKRDQTLKAMIERINAVDVDVFGVMDYWTFEGYKLLRAYLEEGKGICTKTILPGIELRVEAPVKFRLNIHALFSDSVASDRLDEFFSTLRIGNDRAPSKDALREFARSLDDGKLNAHGCKPADRSDDEKMLQLGYETAKVSSASLTEAMDQFTKDEAVIVLPYDTHDGISKLDWKTHPHDDSKLFRIADLLEARGDANVALIVGHRTAGNEDHIDAFRQNLGGSHKPAVSGSDAHAIADYGVFPNGRATWLKADPSFHGLRQVMSEPRGRSFVGPLPPKLQHVNANPTKYITRVSVTRTGTASTAGRWFDLDLGLNPGMVAIIGNKGSGKSALADVLALLGNSQCGQFEFLTKTRFMQGANRGRHFRAQLTWANGEVRECDLDTQPDSAKPERVKYLPQSHIELLCNELEASPKSRFEEELRKVIFLHAPSHVRDRARTLDELIEQRTRETATDLDALRRSLHELNSKILKLDHELGEENKRRLEGDLALAQSQLEAHEEAKPAAVPRPESAPQDEGDQERLDQLHARRDSLTAEVERTAIDLATQRRRLEAVRQLRAALAGFSERHAVFTAEVLSPLAADAGLEVHNLVHVEIDEGPINALEGTLTGRIEELEASVAGGEGSFAAELTATEAAIAAITERLAGPAREYAAYQSALEAWERRRQELVGDSGRVGSIGHIREQLRLIEQELPQKRATVAGERLSLVRKIYAKLAKLQSSYTELFGPVQQLIDGPVFREMGINLQLAVAIRHRDFKERFFRYINHGRAGSFCGKDAAATRVDELLSAHDFGAEAGAVGFVEALLHELLFDARESVARRISEQIKKGATEQEVLDFLFGLEYLEPSYTLHLGGKDISLLSPGEKGALLIAFYLLLDPDDCPLIIDQPEHNLDNKTVYDVLVPCFKQAKERRQVFVVTHNPNLAVVCDAEQVVYSEFSKADDYRLDYESGSLEHVKINGRVVDTLEGTWPAFRSRESKYVPQSP